MRKLRVRLRENTGGANASRSFYFNLISLRFWVHFIFYLTSFFHFTVHFFYSLQFTSFFFHTSFFSSLRFMAKANTVNTFIYYSLNTIIIIIRRDAQYTDEKVDGWHKQSVGWHHLSAILAWRRNRCYDFFSFFNLNVLRKLYFIEFFNIWFFNIFLLYTFFVYFLFVY